MAAHLRYTSSLLKWWVIVYSFFYGTSLCLSYLTRLHTLWNVRRTERLNKIFILSTSVRYLYCILIRYEVKYTEKKYLLRLRAKSWTLRKTHIRRRRTYRLSHFKTLQLRLSSTVKTLQVEPFFFL